MKPVDLAAAATLHRMIASPMSGVVQTRLSGGVPIDFELGTAARQHWVPDSVHWTLYAAGHELLQCFVPVREQELSNSAML